MKVIEWDGNAFGTDYAAALMDGSGLGLPAVRGRSVGRLGKWPLVTGVDRPGRQLALGIAIVGSSVATLRTAMLGWFDPEDETPKKLSITDDDGSSNERYVYAVCEGLQAQPSREGGALGQLYVATLRVHGDVRWRHETEDSDVWNITASGQTNVVANGGDDDAYPRITIEPTNPKSAGYTYKRFVPVYWRVEEGFIDYPFELTNGGLDTATLVSGSKAQADGDDFRVLVDGMQSARWFGTGSYAFNQATTKVWAALDFQADVPMTLKTAIAGSGAITEIEVNEDIGSLYHKGIVVIDSEAFTYTGTNVADRTLTGVTRAMKNTSMAAHVVDEDVEWIQHDIWFMYGNASATAPVQTDTYKPAFSVDSSNTSWDYDDFGAGHIVTGPHTRSGRWTPPQYVVNYVVPYTANRGTQADPREELGTIAALSGGRGTLWNPCGSTAANFQNGEKYSGKLGYWTGEIQSSLNGSLWETEYEVAEPTVVDTWQSWSQNETLDTGSVYVAMYLDHGVANSAAYLEAADVTLTLNSSNTPTVLFSGTEYTNAYRLDCTITNNTTGDAIEVEYLMEEDEELEVDTYEKTVVDLVDDSQQMQALTLVGGARRHWLRLQPGNNTIQFDDTGTSAVTLTMEFAERFYG